MSGLVTQAVPVISAIGGLGALLAVISDRRKRAAEAKKIGAEGGKADAEGQVAISGTTLQWAQRADSRAERAEEKAAQAEADAREANRRADELQRDRDNDRELIADLRKEFEALLERIASCEAGHFCPVADSLTRKR